MRILIGAAALGWLVVVAASAAPQKPALPAPRAAPLSPEEEFFETRVRPVLAEKCYACHGSRIQQAGLRLDNAAGLLKGSDAGPAVVPGDPDRSALIRAVRYLGAAKMPPAGKLPQ